MTITLWWLHFGHPCVCSDPYDWLSSDYVAQLGDEGGAHGSSIVQWRTFLSAAGVAPDVIWPFSSSLQMIKSFPLEADWSSSQACRGIKVNGKSVV